MPTVAEDGSKAEDLRVKALARGVKEYNYDAVAAKTLELYAMTLEHQL